MRTGILVVASLVLAGAGLTIWFVNSSVTPEYSQTADTRSYADRAGTYYGDAPGGDVDIIVAIRELELPLPPGANAIWGASGRDDQGHIWIGVSVEDEPAAHLIEYIPEQDRFVDHGDPVTALKAIGRYQEGARQTKIHSKIIQGDDGYLYFSSMDEEGEKVMAGILPKWGSNLWRYSASESRWEHLFHAPEGLVAITGAGRWIYALGYWDHVLYQYDTRTGQVRHTRVGSVGGHVSRNIIADMNGHAYVPRIEYYDLPGSAEEGGGETSQLLVTSLIEYDQNLDMVDSFPLIHYAGKERPRRNHGITGISYLADHSIVFVTGTGYLYRIIPSQNGPARVEGLGWIHPAGESYTAALFPLDGHDWLLAVGKSRAPDKSEGTRYEVMIYNLRERKSRTIPAKIPGYRYLLLYGSNTRDNSGNNYLVGRYDWHTPIIWQLSLE